jgi:hypothetical protein
MKRSGRALVAALALIGAAPRARADESPAPRIEYRDDRLSVHLDHVPLASVVDAIGKQSGAEIRGTVTAPRDVTTAFENVPLNDALKRLLGDESFTLTYGEQGKLRAIELRGGPDSAKPLAGGTKPALEESKPAGAGAAPWPPNDDVKRSAEAIEQFINSDRSIAVSGRLAAALGGSTSTFQKVAEAAFKDEDPRVRAQALRAAMRSLTEDPELRTAFVTTITSFDDAVIGQFLRNVAGPNAETVAEQIGRHAGSAEIAQKAATVQQQLRAQASPTPGGS